MGRIHQIYQIQRILKLNGQDIEVYRERENKYHEPEERDIICSSRGLFHEANNFLGVTTEEKGRVYADKKPMLLLLYEAMIQKEDIIAIEDREFKVVGIDDLGNLHLLLDLSLEEI